MDYYKEKYRAGVINVKTYEKMMEVVAHLEQNEYGFIESIGYGAYGSVIKIKHLKTEQELAAKIIEKKNASDGEITLWKTLNHKNILPLNDIQFVYYADSYIFLTPVYPTTLEHKVLDPSFLVKKNALTQDITWLRECLDAVDYFHEKCYSHNDIKCNNIFISNAGTATLADFGFLTSAEKPILKYGAPMIYRCPEGRLTEAGLTPINGKNLDIWTVGMLAFEMFTKMSLLTEISKRSNSLSYWFTDIYPALQNGLQKENFTKLMKGAFPNSKEVNQKADDIVNFITSCLNIIPEKRPNVRQLQEHKIFGGAWENVDLSKEVDIWEKKVNIKEFNSILQQNKLDTVPEYLLEKSYHSEYNGSSKLYASENRSENGNNIIVSSEKQSENGSNLIVSGEKQSENGNNLIVSGEKQSENGNNFIVFSEKQSQNDNNIIVSQAYIIEEKVSYCQAEQSINDIDENRLVYDSISAKNRQSAFLRSQKSDQNVMPLTVEVNKLSSTVSVKESSLNISDTQKSKISKCDFGFDLSEINHVASLASSTFDSSNSSKLKKSDDSKKCKRFRKWWKNKKSAVCRVFAACFCCLKKNSQAEK